MPSNEALVALEILRAYVYLALGVRDIHIFRSRPFLGDLDEDQLQILRGESCTSPSTSEDEESSSSKV